jgi:hypothetical protein
MLFARTFVAGAIGWVTLVGCATTLTNLTVLQQAPPHDRDVQIVMDGPAPSSPVLFTADYRVSGNWTNLSAMSPNQEQVEEIKRLGAKHGADVVVVKCGDPGTVGQGHCTLNGHAKAPP